LIDFADAGFGHWARDFAALECAIKFQFMPASDLVSMFDLEEVLAEEFFEGGGTRGISDPAVVKAFNTVKVIRRFADELIVSGDERALREEYYSALYFTSINYFRFHSQVRQKVRKNQILMAAGVAFERSGAWTF
jgi:hypothetical protein